MPLYNKHGVEAIRFKKGSYNIKVKMSNQNICLYNLVDFKTLPLVGQLNKNLFKNVEVETDEEEKSGKILFLFHDFFKMFHIKQKYLYLQGNKIENLEETEKEFVISNLGPDTTLELQNCDQLKIENVKFVVFKKSETECFVDCDISFQIPFPLPSFVEKMAIHLCLRFVVFTKKYFEKIL